MKDNNFPFMTVQRAIMWAILIFVVGVAWTHISRKPAELATQQAAPPPNPKEGFTAPDFTLELLEGGEITLTELRGKPVVINFWATWCGPCREEMPAIEKVYRSYKDLGLVVIGLNLTSQDTQEAVVAFVQEFGLTFPIVLGVAHVLSGDAYGAPSSLPWSVFLWADYRHPSQIYETVGAIGIFLATMRRPFGNLGAGLNFIFFIAVSAAARIFLEAFRGDSMIWAGGFRAAQVIGLGVLAVSTIFMHKWSNKNGSPVSNGEQGQRLPKHASGMS